MALSFKVVIIFAIAQLAVADDFDCDAPTCPPSIQAGCAKDYQCCQMGSK